MIRYFDAFFNQFCRYGPVNEHLSHAETAGDGAGMLTPGTTETSQHMARRVMTFGLQWFLIFIYNLIQLGT